MAAMVIAAGATSHPDDRGGTAPLSSVVTTPVPPSPERGGGGVGIVAGAWDAGQGQGDDQQQQGQDQEPKQLLGPGTGVDPRVCVFLTLHHPAFSPLASVIAGAMGIVILVSCFGFVLGSMSRFEHIPDDCAFPVCIPGPNTLCTRVVCKPEPIQTLKVVETVTVAIFTVELLLRLLTVHAAPQRLIYPQAYIDGKLGAEEPPGWRKTLAYCGQGMNVIDFLAVAPYYLSYFRQIDAKLPILRLLRIMRVFRIFKLGRYTVGGELLQETLRTSASALGLLLFFAGVICLVFSSVMYYLELGIYTVTAEHPDGAFLRPTTKGDALETSPFASIPVAAYFSLVTATTLGYGDITPATPGGRAVAILLSYLGIIGIALPSSIIAKSFYDCYFVILARRREERRLLEEARAEVAARAAAGRGGAAALALVGGPSRLNRSDSIRQPPTPTAAPSTLCCGFGAGKSLRALLMRDSGVAAGSRREGRQDSLVALAEAAAKQRAAEEAAAEKLLDDDDGNDDDDEAVLEGAGGVEPVVSRASSDRDSWAPEAGNPAISEQGQPQRQQQQPSPAPVAGDGGWAPPPPLLVARASSGSGGGGRSTGGSAASASASASASLASTTPHGSQQSQGQQQGRRERREREEARHRKATRLAHALREHLTEIAALHERLQNLESSTIKMMQHLEEMDV